MIATTAQENEIISKILKTVFNSDATVSGIRIDDITVVVSTSHGWYSIGKDYFRELVQKFKQQ